MRMRLTYTFLTILFTLSILSSCEKEGLTYTEWYTVDVPIFALRADVQDSIAMEAARSLCTAGNIYARNQYLYVNETGKGWHVIDNSDPNNPSFKAFWVIPGSTQLAFIGDRAVVDSYGDLLTLNVGADLTIHVESTAANLLSQRGYDLPSSHIVVGYTRERKEFTRDRNTWRCEDFCNEIDVASFDSNGSRSANSSSQPGFTNAGSLSRFATYQDYIYSVQMYGVATFQLTDSIRSTSVNYRGSELETGVVRGDKLYVGSATGMLIYDLANPAEPQYLSIYSHIRGCDPVAVDGDRAVVTVRDGNNCNVAGPVNTLTVLDISNPRQPQELSVSTMEHPHGVAIFDNKIYLCEGRHGFKVFDFSGERRQAGRLLTQRNEPAIDVMALPYRAGLVLMTVSEKGFVLYEPQTDESLEIASRLIASPCN